MFLMAFMMVPGARWPAVISNSWFQFIIIIVITMMMMMMILMMMMMITDCAGTDCRLLVPISEFGSGQHLLHTLCILITNIVIIISSYRHHHHHLLVSSSSSSSSSSSLLIGIITTSNQVGLI